MSKHIVTVADSVEPALEIVATKDGITVDALIQMQLDYYLSTVIKGYVETPVELTKEQIKDLDVLLATTKANYLSTI